MKIKCDEYHEQVAVVDFIYRQYPQYANSLTANAYAGTNKVRGMMLRAMGYKAGTPDLWLMIPNKQYHALIIEMKTKTGQISTEQIEFVELLNKNGYKAVICKGSDEAINIIKEYLGGK